MDCLYPRDLPQPARKKKAFCLPGLQLDANRPYGTLQCIPPRTPRSAVTVDQIYFIGDSRSACELEVFTDMPIERVGCGLQCTLPHLPLGSSSRCERLYTPGCIPYCMDAPYFTYGCYVFSSHDHIHYVRIQWEGHPLLLFSDPKMVAPDYTTKFRDQASHVTHQQHLQMSQEGHGNSGLLRGWCHSLSSCPPGA